MSWNNGYERKRFEKKLKKQREIYAKQGMTNSQIEEIEKLDWEIFNSDRRFFTHNQPLEFDDFEEETKNPLMFYFAHDFFDTVSPDYSDKEWWIDELEDERIYALVKKLSDEEKTILTMIAFAYPLWVRECLRFVTPAVFLRCRPRTGATAGRRAVR